MDSERDRYEEDLMPHEARRTLDMARFYFYHGLKAAGLVKDMEDFETRITPILDLIEKGEMDCPPMIDWDRIRKEIHKKIDKFTTF